MIYPKMDLNRKRSSKERARLQAEREYYAYNNKLNGTKSNKQALPTISEVQKPLSSSRAKSVPKLKPSNKKND